MSTRSKQKTPKASDASYWTPADKANLVEFLMTQGAVPGANYKPQVWSEAASRMKNPPEQGALKTANSCKTKWRRVSQYDQISLLSDVIHFR